MSHVFNELLSNIERAFSDRFKERSLVSLDDQRGHPTKQKAPSISIDLVDFDSIHDVGNGQLDMRLSFEARIMSGFEKTKNSRLEVRNLAAEVVMLLHKNDFGAKNTSLADNINASDDQIYKDFSGLESWLVSWDHTFRIGENVFDSWSIAEDRVSRA